MLDRTSKKTPKSSGLIQVYTGDGKGKTTASLGLALRAVSQGVRVAIVHFDKGGTHYAERGIIGEKFPGEIDLFSTGLDRIDPKTNRFRFGVTPEDRAEAERGLAIVRDVFRKGEHGLVIMDEINCTVSLGMLDERDALAVIAEKPPETELVLTGRNAPDAFRALADLVTEMTLVKHYFYKGVPARYGLDY
ncbi:MAG TPA: cob(I)yrinic acid a,c-diamide adenosyltransferase [Patescibacteria group bacterium]|nr:cob(I)yrinic acid a,c-diamide adenosyltransferase [Patescibacteria group bacterium]